MTDKIDLAISLGKIKGAKVLLNEYLANQDKAQWMKAKQDEYNILFPTYRDMTADEITDRYNMYLIEYPDGITQDEYETRFNSGFTIAIDYSQDENYLSFNDWLAETKEVLIGTETATDDDGAEYEKEIFETQLVIEPYTLTKDFTDEIEAHIRKATTPQVVTMRQARLALLDVGMLDVVQGAIETSGNEAVKIEWEYATDIRRDWTSFIALTTSMGMTSDELDDLFILAGSK